jgi:hypothetical protein
MTFLLTSYIIDYNLSSIPIGVGFCKEFACSRKEFLWIDRNLMSLIVNDCRFYLRAIFLVTLFALKRHMIMCEGSFVY